MTSPALDAWGLHKTWQKGAVRPLDGFELTVEAGEGVWIEGANGAGKTTLLRILAGLIGADAGHVRSHGLHPFLDRREFQRNVVFMSAGNTGLYARLTTRQQIDTWARFSFVPRAERAVAVEGVIDELELGSLADRRSDRLSLGQRQRMRIAMTVVSDARLILLDEPSTSLDRDGRRLLLSALARRKATGTALVWIAPTGDTPAESLDRHFVLDMGRLRSL